MKGSNILLILVFLVLIALVGYLFWGGGQQKQRTFRDKLVEIDTMQVNAIRITPKGGSELSIWKEAGNWKVKNDTFSGDAEKGKVEQLIGELTFIKPKSLTTKSKSAWVDYEVDEENAMRVIVEQENKKDLELLIGKFTIQQPKTPPVQGANPNQQQPQMKPISYVRIAGENEVYSVDGLLNMSLNRKPGDLTTLPPPPPPDSTNMTTIDTTMTK